MKKLISAIVLSTLLHLLLVFNILSHHTKADTTQGTKKYEKITLVKLRVQKEVPKEVPKNIKKTVKKTEKKKQSKQKEEVSKKNTKNTKNIKKQKQSKKVNIQDSYQKDINKFYKKIDKANKKVVEKLPKNSQKSKKDEKNKLMSYLSAPSVDAKTYDDLAKSYLNLYGKKFEKFTKIQKAYIEKHLEDIGLITQRYLYYPDSAVATRSQGGNVVQFYLHPNGDISDLILLQSSGYSTLDDNSLQTVRVAYKDYPRPKQVTLIRIFINYRLR